MDAPSSVPDVSSWSREKLTAAYLMFRNRWADLRVELERERAECAGLRLRLAAAVALLEEAERESADLQPEMMAREAKYEVSR